MHSVVLVTEGRKHADVISRFSFSTHRHDLRQLRRRWLRSVRTRPLARNHLCRYRVSILRLDAGYLAGHFVEERLGQEYSQANIGDEDRHSHLEIIRMYFFANERRDGESPFV